MGQAQVDDWCDDLAKTHYVRVSDTKYAAVPREVRGVPHYTVPGLHAYLDDYERALERVRGLLGVEDRHTVDSLQALAFGPYSERLAPHIAESSDPTTSKSFRNPDDRTYSDGRAFQADSTCPDLSVFREPLVPCVAITAPQDNIFAQCQPFLASVFGAMAVIARQARTAHRLAHPELPPEVTRPREELAFLHRLCCALHTGEPLLYEGSRCNHFLAACVMPMLNVFKPASHEMAGDVVLDAYERAPAAIAAAMRQQARDGEPVVGRSLPQLVEDGLLSEDSLAEARAFWAPFARTNPSTSAWTRLTPLLMALLEADGSYDNSLATLDALWEANDQLLRAAAWFAASPDGWQAPEHPSPIAGVRSWTQVRAEHLTPVFVGYSNPQTGKHVPARSSLVGVMPMGFQQLLHLLMGASSMPHVRVKYAHNFGYLIYRPSAAPDIMTSKNRERSSKAISCVNVEGDEQAFGTREEKVKMCKLHRAAWAANLDAVKPLCTAIAPPLPDGRRARGDRGEIDFIKQQKRDLDVVGMHTKQECDAAALFHRAVLDSCSPR